MEKTQLWNANHRDMNVWELITVGDNGTSQLFRHLQMLLRVSSTFGFYIRKVDLFLSLENCILRNSHVAPQEIFHSPKNRYL